MLTVRDAYNIVFEDEYTFATFKGLTVDQANRHAARMAVKYAWSEFNKRKKRKPNESLH